MLLITITRDSGNIYIRRNDNGSYRVMDVSRAGPINGIHEDMTAIEVVAYLRDADFPIEVLS